MLETKFSEDGLIRCEKCADWYDPAYPCLCMADEKDWPLDSNLHGITSIAKYLGLSPKRFEKATTDPRSYFHMWKTADNKYHTHINSAYAGQLRWFKENPQEAKKNPQDNLILWIKRTDQSSGSIGC